MDLRTGLILLNCTTNHLSWPW